MTHPYVCHDSSICVTGFIHVRGMTHSRVWHAAFIYVTWLSHILDSTHTHIGMSRVTHMSCVTNVNAPCHMYACAMSHTLKMMSDNSGVLSHIWTSIYIKTYDICASCMYEWGEWQEEDWSDSIIRHVNEACHINRVKLQVDDSCHSWMSRKTWHHDSWDTGWRRPIGCLKSQVIFCKRATNYRYLLRKRRCRTWDTHTLCVGRYTWIATKRITCI